ncbi:aldo/keto reductase family oxidoreductase, partial [mine drainage metagenome]
MASGHPATSLASDFARQRAVPFLSAQAHSFRRDILLETRVLGRTGIEVTLCGVGTWAMGSSWGQQEDQDSRAALHRSLDLGCRFIDTAQSYGQGRSERLVGDVLRERGERVP